METEYENLFNALIIAPLQKVAGRLLRAVNYYIIWGEFDPEAPNESGGCQGIHLVFDGGEVEFDWAWENPFRDLAGGIAYHLAVSDHSVRRDAIREWTEDDISGLNLIPGTDTRLWKGLVGEPLLRVEVLGEWLDENRCSPQAARLHFPSALVTIAIGMTQEGDQPVSDVGDGDEILVFNEPTWVALFDQGIRGINTLLPCWEFTG